MKAPVREIQSVFLILGIPFKSKNLFSHYHNKMEKSGSTISEL